MRLGLAFLLVAAFIAVCASPAAARYSLVATGTNIVHTDARRAAFGDGPDVRVVDVPTGQWSKLTAPSGCRFTSLGAGEALWSCDALKPHETSARILDLPTGEVHEFDEQGGAAGETATFFGIGSQWVGESWDEPHSPGGVVSYANWRTGQHDYTGDWDTPTTFADPSSPSPSRRLCAPLKRSLDPFSDELGGTGHDYLAVQSEGRFVLLARSLTTSTETWELRRCGSGKRVLRFRDPRTPMLANGWLTWLQGNTVRAYALARRRSFRWKLSGVAAGVSTLDVAAHTGTRMFVGVTMRDGTEAVYRARLPRPSG